MPLSREIWYTTSVKIPVIRKEHEHDAHNEVAGSETLLGGGGVCLAVTLTFSPASAATYYVNTSGSNGAPPKCFKFYSDEACTTEVSITPTKDDGNTYIVLGSATMAGSYTAPAGTTWIFGRDGVNAGTTASITTFLMGLAGGCSFDYGNCTMYGVLSKVNSNGTYYWRGTNTLVKTTKADNITFMIDNTAGDTARSFDLAGAFIADTDVTTKLLGKGSWSLGLNAEPIFRLSGDFTDYKGKFLVTSEETPNPFVTRIELMSSSAFGDPKVEAADYLTLKSLVGTKSSTRGVFFPIRWSIDPSVVQYSTKGIVLDLTTTAPTNEIYAAEGSSWTLTAPVAVKTTGVGVMAKVGAGTVTLNGPVSVPNVIVREGTLVIGKDVKFEVATTLTIQSGAQLVSQLGTDILNVTLVRESGSSFSYDFTVPYANGETTELDCSSLTAADWEGLTKPVPVQLSEAIALPCNESNRLALVKFPTSLGVTADDFKDATPKTYGLPITWFEVERNEDGHDVVYLNARPAIVYMVHHSDAGNKGDVLLIGPTMTLADGEEHALWSDGLSPHAGADYAVTNGANTMTAASWGGETTFAFAGESLTYANGGGLRTNFATNSFKRLVLNDGFEAKASGYTGGNEKRHVFTGALELPSGTVAFKGAKYPTTGAVKWLATYEIAATVTGAGTLSFTGDCGGLTPKMTGDFTGFDGQVTANMTATYGTPALVETESLSALMAGRTTYTRFGLHAEGAYNGFLVTEDDVYENANGNVFLFGDDSILSVAEGKTLAMKGSLALNATTSKRGAGVLAIGGRVRYSSNALDDPSSASAKMVIREGYVQPLEWNGGGSYRQMRFQIASASAGFAFDPAVTDEHVKTYGLCLSREDAIEFATGIDAIPAKILLGADGTRVTERIVVPVLTVPDALLSGKMSGKELKVVKNYKGAKATVTSAAATGMEGCTTFTVTLDPVGLAVIIR